MPLQMVVPDPSELGPFLPAGLGNALAALPRPVWAEVEEIRLRAGQPVLLITATGEMVLGPDGRPGSDIAQAPAFTLAEARQLFAKATQSSAYALQEQLAAGYLTLPGGHRLGLTGRAVLENGLRLAGLRDVSCFCLRLAREVRGAADAILPGLIDRARGRLISTLLVSPPRCGKTTVLRDAVRQLSGGDARQGLVGFQVALIDERSEVAGWWRGVATREVGPRTDVLDACPKAAGMLLALRAMSPDLLATDELGRPEDVQAVEEAGRGGVALLATAHGWDAADVMARPMTRELILGGHFGRIVFLSRRLGPGTVETIMAPNEFRRAAS